MHFSERTIQLLTNFATICPSIVLQNDGHLRTISDNGSLLAAAKIEEIFPVAEFPILELNKLLQVLKMPSFKNAEIEFAEDSKKIEIKSDFTSLNFWASAKELTVLPPDSIVVQDVKFEANMSGDQIKEFTRACSNLGHKTARFTVEDGHTYITGTTPDIDNSNDIKIKLGDTTHGDFQFNIDVDNMKLIDAGYTIAIDPSLQLACFTTDDGTLQYFIGQQID